MSRGPPIALAAAAMLGAPALAQDGGAPDPTEGAFPLALYGVLAPSAGAWVEYKVTAKGAPGPVTVRVASSGEIESRGEKLEQVEILSKGEPATLTVLWIRRDPGGEDRLRRVALWVKPHAALAVPLDKPASPAADRGEPGPTSTERVRIPLGTLDARRADYRRKDGPARVWRSAEVPVFGVARLEMPGETWVAAAKGTGAQTELTTVPLTVPRVKRKE